MLNRKKRSGNRFFTMIEMLIVITIIVIFSGVIGINIAKALREQQFNTDVALVVERLRLAQNLMIILDKDVRVDVKSTPDGLEMKLDVKDGVPDKWQFVIDRSKILLKAIHSIQFDDALNYLKTPGALEILFYSGGSVMSKGVIHLSTHENRKENTALSVAIILYGYPHPIESVKEGEDPLKFEQEDQQYDVRLTNQTVEEIRQYENTGKETPAST